MQTIQKGDGVRQVQITEDSAFLHEEDINIQPHHPNQEFNTEQAFNTQPNTESDPTYEKGILKYYKKGDYFLAGTTTGDASKQKGEEHAQLQQEEAQQEKQGTLLGVFFPVMQNILGVLLFIRVPEITGESGIRDSVIIVALCVTTTFLTILSLSAIATNGRISTGGTYYLISRSLGAPIGTGVGFSFYLGTTFAGAMYILGAVESFIKVTGWKIGGSEGASMRIYGTILLVLMITVNLVGLKYVAKTGMVFLSVVLFAILGMYIGIFTQNARDAITADNGMPDIEDKYKNNDGITGLSSKHWDNNWEPEYDENDLFTLLSIYFPSVTGIMAGANRSGDLKDPSYSLPRGTLGAQLFTSVIYLSFPMLFGAVCDRGTLQTGEYLIAAEGSWPSKYITIVAIILSSTGAGLQSLAGAPRLLYAVADDDNLPCFRIFKGKLQRIILLTGIICFGAIMIGEIDVITPVITMFFLLCYCFVNICCIFLDVVAFPNWRPTWKFYHAFFSFLGAGLCLFLMIAISPIAFAIAVVFSAILFVIVITNKKVNSHYGDSIDAVRLSTAKSSLVGLIKSSKHVKNWIPIVLVIGDYDDSKKHNDKLESKGALFFLNTIKQDISFIVYGTWIEGNYSFNDVQKVKETEKGISQWLEKEKLNVISKVVMVEKRKSETDNINNPTDLQLKQIKEQESKYPQQGMLFLMQAAGIGGLEPNTIMMEFPERFKSHPEKAERFVQFVSYGVRFGKAIIATFNDNNFAPKMEFLADQEAVADVKRVKNYDGSIDVWTFSYENGLQILITYFLSRSKVWKNCNVNLHIVTLGDKDSNKDLEKERIQEKVNEFLFRYRLLTNKISVHVEIIESSEWQQMEGYILTEGKQQQIQQNPHQFSNMGVDPTSNYGMDLNVKKAEQQQHQQTLQQPQQQKSAERQLSVMSQNQVDKLNQLIQSKSGSSQLVIMNLPEPVNQQTMDYLTYLKNMTKGLNQVLMIRNSDQECITEFT